jgi:hypothetical protein
MRDGIFRKGGTRLGGEHSDAQRRCGYRIFGHICAPKIPADHSQPMYTSFETFSAAL